MFVVILHACPFVLFQHCMQGSHFGFFYASLTLAKLSLAINEKFLHLGKDRGRNRPRRKLLFPSHRGNFRWLVHLWVHHSIHCGSPEVQVENILKFQGWSILTIRVNSGNIMSYFICLCFCFLRFIKAGMNIIDLMGVVPYFMSLFIRYLGERYVLFRLCRLF